MKKYKLIKEYPGSPTLGVIDTIGHYANHPEYWQEIIEVPEYVKCVKEYIGVNVKSIIGKIYPINSQPYFSAHTWTDILSFFNENFTPSTKEEYDLQQKYIDEVTS
jgi:hypothetical protein